MRIMIVPIIAVVLRLGAFYVLWWGIQAGVPLLAIADGAQTVQIGAVTLVLSAVVAVALWIFAKPLAAILYPYETDTETSVALDVDRLEVMAVQMVGLILIVSALQDVIFVLHRVVTVWITMGLDARFGDYGFQDVWLVSRTVSALLTALVGLVLIIRVDGVLAIFRKLRRLG